MTVGRSRGAKQRGQATDGPLDDVNVSRRQLSRGTELLGQRANPLFSPERRPVSEPAVPLGKRADQVVCVPAVRRFRNLATMQRGQFAPKASPVPLRPRPAPTVNPFEQQPSLRAIVAIDPAAGQHGGRPDRAGASKRRQSVGLGTEEAVVDTGVRLEEVAADSRPHLGATIDAPASQPPHFENPDRTGFDRPARAGRKVSLRQRAPAVRAAGPQAGRGGRGRTDPGCETPLRIPPAPRSTGPARPRRGRRDRSPA